MHETITFHKPSHICDCAIANGQKSRVLSVFQMIEAEKYEEAKEAIELAFGTIKPPGGTGPIMPKDCSVRKHLKPASKRMTQKRSISIPIS